MFVLLVIHLLVGVGIVAAGGVLGRRAFLVASLAPLATVLWASAQAGDVLDGHPVTESFAWVEQLGITIDLRLDAFALLHKRAPTVPLLKQMLIEEDAAP